ALAALAVVVLTVEGGKLPWVSLALAFSFAAYGFFRKTLPVGPSQGFLLEVLLLSIPCLVYVGYLFSLAKTISLPAIGAILRCCLGAGRSRRCRCFCLRLAPSCLGSRPSASC